MCIRDRQYEVQGYIDMQCYPNQRKTTKFMEPHQFILSYVPVMVNNQYYIKMSMNLMIARVL